MSNTTDRDRLVEIVRPLVSRVFEQDKDIVAEAIGDALLPVVCEMQAEAVERVRDGFDQWAVRWKRTGWGSNQADRQTLNFAADALLFIRKTAAKIRAGTE